MTIYRTNIAEVPSASVRYSKNEFGFYIACDDRSILKCINSMLLDNGMVGLSDTEGKVHYLIDGRRGGNYVLGRVKEKVLTLREPAPSDNGYEDAIVYRAIDSVMKRYGFMDTLSGTRILRYLLFRLYRDPKLLKSAVKCLYPLARAEFQMSPAQVERNLRYAIRKSPKLKEETRVIMILRKLHDKTIEEVLSRYGRAY